MIAMLNERSIDIPLMRKSVDSCIEFERLLSLHFALPIGIVG